MVLRWEFDLEEFDFGIGFRKRRSKELTGSVERHLLSLYKELIGPLREKINDKRNLIIIPHGYLHKIPFHALFDGKSYLSDDFNVSYAPSATALSQILNYDWSGIEKALLIGISTGGMPGLDAEIEEIADILPDVRMVTDPVEAVDVLSGGISGYDLLHLGCHGAFRSDNPGYSYLDFGIRKFTANDIAALSIDVPLVTLSSCSSAKSVVMDGDEIIGMARGFLSSGAKAFIASLWKVDDYATKELMISFYRNLKLGMSRVESLRAAQIELRRSFPHPYYWAPFVLMGSG
jgi:CHAT domain-containing protein